MAIPSKLRRELEAVVTKIKRILDEDRREGLKRRRGPAKTVRAKLLGTPRFAAQIGGDVTHESWSVDEEISARCGYTGDSVTTSSGPSVTCMACLVLRGMESQRLKDKKAKK